MTKVFVEQPRLHQICKTNHNFYIFWSRKRQRNDDLCPCVDQVKDQVKDNRKGGGRGVGGEAGGGGGSSSSSSDQNPQKNADDGAIRVKILKNPNPKKLFIA